VGNELGDVQMKRLFNTILVGLAMCTGSALAAQTLQLTDGRSEARIELNGQTFVIQRLQELVSASAARPAPEWNCPPDCIQPIEAAPGVTTIGELETIRFLETMVAEGDGLLIDSRFPGPFTAGTIPGAVNVPALALAPDNPYVREIMIALGAVELGNGELDFTDALEIAVFCDGPSSAQSIKTIDKLMSEGYPAEKLYYYRGGLQDWQALGLSLWVQQNAG
jgi:rhodanese-related sulfurtransferase